MELSLSPATTIAWIINYIILFIALSVAVLVFRDARKRNMSFASTLVWAAVSLFTFPVGTLVYVFYGRK